MIRFTAILAITISAVSSAWAADCFSTSKAVFAKYGNDDVHPRFTHYMKSHRGEACWYKEGDFWERADSSEKPRKVRAVKVAPPPPPPAPALKVRAWPRHYAASDAVVVNVIAEVRALFPDRSEPKDMTVEEWVMSERLKIAGYAMWLRHSSERIQDARDRLVEAKRNKDRLASR